MITKSYIPSRAKACVFWCVFILNISFSSSENNKNVCINQNPVYWVWLLISTYRDSFNSICFFFFLERRPRLSSLWGTNYIFQTVNSYRRFKILPCCFIFNQNVGFGLQKVKYWSHFKSFDWKHTLQGFFISTFQSKAKVLLILQGNSKAKIVAVYYINKKNITNIMVLKHQKSSGWYDHHQLLLEPHLLNQ